MKKIKSVRSNSAPEPVAATFKSVETGLENKYHAWRYHFLCTYWGDRFTKACPSLAVLGLLQIQAEVTTSPLSRNFISFAIYSYDLNTPCSSTLTSVKIYFNKIINVVARTLHLCMLGIMISSSVSRFNPIGRTYSYKCITIIR